MGYNSIHRVSTHGDVIAQLGRDAASHCAVDAVERMSCSHEHVASRASGSKTHMWPRASSEEE